MQLTLGQKILVAAVAGAVVAVVSVLIQHHGTRLLQARSVRISQPPSP